MSYNVYKLFEIDYDKLVEDKLYICKEWHVQPSEIDRMPYFEYEKIKDIIVKVNKRQAEEQRREEARQRRAAPKMPKMPDYRMPSFSNFKMPKL